MRLWADLDEYKSNHYGSYLIFVPHDEISLAVQKKTVQLGFPKIDFPPSRVSIGRYRVKMDTHLFLKKCFFVNSSFIFLTEQVIVR